MRFPAASYPGRPPDGPVLVYAGRRWPLVVDGDVHRPVRPADGPGAPPVSAPVLSSGPARWSFAYGANADPRRLLDKGLDGHGAMLLPARLRGWRRVWEARRSPVTGAVPLTVQHDPQAVLDGWVLGVHRDDTAVLDASEGRGERYTLGRLGPAAVAARFLLDAAFAYQPGPATRVLVTERGPATFPEVDQAQAARLLAAGRSAPAVRPAPIPPDPEGWPPTPLDDLPLFTYGTLQPGQERHGAVAPLVVNAGPAQARGEVVPSRHGWPAATFADGGDPIHGTLLAPTDRAAAARLVAAADAVEDVPRLFRRVAVEVAAGGGARWAMAYEWNGAGAA